MLDLVACVWIIYSMSSAIWSCELCFPMSLFSILSEKTASAGSVGLCVWSLSGCCITVCNVFITAGHDGLSGCSVPAL